jgi:hypothetical protein
MSEPNGPSGPYPEDIWELLNDAEIELNKSHVYANTPLLARIRSMRIEYQNMLNASVEQSELELPVDPNE